MAQRYDPSLREIWEELALSMMNYDNHAGTIHFAVWRHGKSQRSPTAARDETLTRSASNWAAHFPTVMGATK